jgi:hypothetical protein
MKEIIFVNNGRVLANKKHVQHHEFFFKDKEEIAGRIEKMKGKFDLVKIEDGWYEARDGYSAVATYGPISQQILDFVFVKSGQWEFVPKKGYVGGLQEPIMPEPDYPGKTYPRVLF